MYRRQALDLDHRPGTDQYRGLAHAHCNRSDGAKRGNQQRRTRRAAQQWTSRQW